MKSTKTSKKSAKSSKSISVSTAAAVAKVFGKKKSGASFTRDSFQNSVDSLTGGSPSETTFRALRPLFNGSYEYDSASAKYVKA